jgi:KipI family sensor histidine kinase inhibitor
MRVLPAGDRALLVELDDLAGALDLFRRVGSARLPGVQELVPAARTLLVCFDPRAVTAARLAGWLRQQADAPPDLVHGPAGGAGPLAAAMRCIDIPVRYDGEDLDELAEWLGLTRGELIERHAGCDFQAAFAGFAPGFVYLVGDDPCFDGIPRRATSRTRVPAGSVAVAGGFSAVYPAASPGGWQLLGVTPLRMWDLDRAEPALVQPGFRVRFRDLDVPQRSFSLADPRSTPEARPGPRVSGFPGDPGQGHVAGDDPVRAQAGSGGASRPRPGLRVLAAGLQTLIQDGGRPGLARLGVTRSGVLDRAAQHEANRLVGNPSGAAVLENVLGGLCLAAQGRVVVAVTGARARVTLTTPAGVRLPAAARWPLVLDEGCVLRIGPVREGVRCYVAVRGGWDIEPVLGSRATDTLSGIGPAPVRAHDFLPVGALPGVPDWPREAPQVEPLPKAGQTVTLGILPGPRADWFEPEALARLTRQAWVVTAQSNRVGMRLCGPQPLVRSRTDELPSEGTVAGAIQVPPSGQPVLFLADHPLTGGYPVIAVVLDRDLDRAAQIPVGARLRFRALAAFDGIGA